MPDIEQEETKLIGQSQLSKVFSIIKQTFLTPTDVKNEILNTETGFAWLERNKRYEVGDVVCKDDLGDGLYLQCIEAGTTGSTEPTQADS